MPFEDNGPSLPVAQGLAPLSIYEGEFGSIPKFMEYINAYTESYKQLALDELARQYVRASNERVKHAISLIDWGFYIF